ncbi:MAG: hypothetical protein R6U43_09770 [Candidatus Krumholzibacteriales bacterium]
MKKGIIFIAAILMVIVQAGKSEPYSIIFVEEGAEPGAGNCDLYPALYAEYQVRIWVQNDTADGFISCRLDIDTGDDAITGKQYNPDFPVITEGNFAFPECQYDQWVWLCVYSILYSGTPHYLAFIPDSNTGEMNVTTCRTENYPVEDLPAGNEFGVNQPCVYDAGEESWGAVKAVYR